MSKKKSHEYLIKILFDKSRNECYCSGKKVMYLPVKNPSSQEKYDDFEFNGEYIEIKAIRTKLFQDDIILSHTDTSLNKQMMKAIMWYYALASDFPEIDSIEITIDGGKRTYSKSTDFWQPIITDRNRLPKSSLSGSFSQEQMEILFEERTPKSKAIKTAMTYLLGGVYSDVRTIRLEQLWRAYNTLYSYYSISVLNKPSNIKEREELGNIKEYFEKHQSDFPKTLSEVKSLTVDQVQKINWYRLFMNAYKWKKTSSQARNKKNKNAKVSAPLKIEIAETLVDKYSDSRVLEAFKACGWEKDKNADKVRREKYLKKLENKIKRQDEKDDELVTLIGTDYAYCYRCQLFHGNIADTKFKIHADIVDEELDIVSLVLENLVIEMLKSFIKLN